MSCEAKEKPTKAELFSEIALVAKMFIGCMEELGLDKKYMLPGEYDTLADLIREAESYVFFD